MRAILHQYINDSGKPPLTNLWDDGENSYFYYLNQARKTTNSFLRQTTKDASINELVATSSQTIQMGH